MEEESLRFFVGKYVSLTTQNGYHYSGKFLHVNGSDALFLDKFGKQILFALENLVSVEELGGAVP